MRRALALALLAAGCQQAPPAGGNDGGSIADGAVDASRPEGPLARYVGKYPDEKVDGRSFVEEPLVLRAVAERVNASVAALVLGSGTRRPIAARDGQLVAAGCTPDDCDGSNWALLIQPDGRAPQVCVKPAGGAPRWYGTAPVGAAKDSCPRG